MLPCFNEKERPKERANKVLEKTLEVASELGQTVAIAKDGTKVVKGGAVTEESFPNLSPNL